MKTLTQLTLLFVLLVTFVSAQLPPEELQAIADMKAAIPSLAYTWSSTTSEVCNSNSLTMTCSGGHVTMIDLGNQQLTGYLPDSIGNFSMLQTLKLYYNGLTGTIPETIGNLSNLQVLELGKNSFSGGIPESFGNLKKLTRLILSYIGLTGTIPANFGGMTSLQSLDMSGNSLTGGLPESIGMLSSLTSFGATDNQLDGTLPDSIGNMTSLGTWAMSNNQLTGTFPNTVEGLTLVSQITMQNNKFYGTVPAALGRLPKLRLLSLDNNKFTGCLSMENIPELGAGFNNNLLCCADNRYAAVPYTSYPCQVSGRLQILTNEVVQPSSTYYTSLSVVASGALDLTNQTELITAECLTINGTIRVNMSLVDSSTQLTDIDLIKFTCSSTNISSIAMDIITRNECQSSYQIREKIVGRTRTVNADITVECPDRPGVPSSSTQPSTSSSPMVDNPFSPSHSPQGTVASMANSVQFMMYVMLYCFAVIM